LEHSAIFGHYMGLSAGVVIQFNTVWQLCLKQLTMVNTKYRDDVLEYGEKARIYEKMFISNDFRLVYDRDLDEPIADGFYYNRISGTVSGRI